jgi:hypothetical protein
MVYGKAFVKLQNVSATSTSAQDITQDNEDIIAYAQKHDIPISLVGLSNSGRTLGPVNMEALSIKSEAYHGVLPAIGMTASVKNKKLTFTAIS